MPGIVSTVKRLIFFSYNFQPAATLLFNIMLCYYKSRQFNELNVIIVSTNILLLTNILFHEIIIIESIVARTARRCNNAIVGKWLYYT